MKHIFLLLLLACTGFVGAQDVLVMKNGDELKVKVIEVNPTEIKYKITEPASDVLHVIYKHEAFMVKYGNGTKEVFGLSSPNMAYDNNKVNLHLQDNGRKKIVAGAVMTGLGVPMLIAGIATAIGSASHSYYDYNTGTYYNEPNGGGVVAGTFMALTGAALTIIGPITLSRGIHARRAYKSNLSFAPGAVKLSF